MRGGGETRERCLQPYAPKKLGGIAEAKVEEGKLAWMGWDFEHAMEKQNAPP